MAATAGPERVAFTVTTDFGLGAVPTVGAGVAVLDARHQLLPSSYDGDTLGVLVEHVTSAQAMVWWGVYSSGSNQIARAATADAIKFSTDGTETEVDFDVGTKRVQIIATGADFEAILADLLETAPTSHATTHVTSGDDKIRDATASQDGLMTTAYATALDDLAAALAYEPENF